MGITGQDLVEKDDAVKQLDLFSYEQDAKDEPILSIIDQINQKYGEQLLKKVSKGREKKLQLPEQALAKIFLRRKRLHKLSHLKCYRKMCIFKVVVK